VGETKRENSRLLPVSDLRIAAEFWQTYEDAGKNAAELSRRTGIAVSSIKGWRDHHERGHVYSDGAWMTREAAKERDKPDHTAALLEYLLSRTVPQALGPTAAASPGDYATCLVLSDPHYPFHHERAFEVVLGLANYIKPTEIVVNGDCFDFAQIGHYIKDPFAHQSMWSDIQAGKRDILARIDAASPLSVKRFIVGNHEEGRWKNYLFSKCPEIADVPMLTMEAMLGLTEMGWVWQPWEYWPTDQLCVYHGDRHTSALGGGSAMSARKESIDMGVSTVTGHTHHAGMFFRQDRAGYRVSCEIGWLGDWRKMQAAHVTTRRTPTKTEDWHLCCALIRYRPGHSAFKVELIPIIDDGRTFAIYQDEVIAA
jgi:hypothetical protein